MGEEPSYLWQDPVTDDGTVKLVRSYGGRPHAGWWDQIRAHNLGWVTARVLLVGFVNVAWDGGGHAFLLDTLA